jgi:hypothetical protein
MHKKAAAKLPFCFLGSTARQQAGVAVLAPTLFDQSRSP